MWTVRENEYLCCGPGDWMANDVSIWGDGVLSFSGNSQKINMMDFGWVFI